MDIKFKELKIENFMSIGDALIDLSDRGFTLLEGVNNNDKDNARSNGSGKSSIFEALVWALTGNTIRGNKDIVNVYGNDGALVKLTFVVDNNIYVITRTKEHSKHKTNLFIEINGIDKSGKGIRDTEKLLSEYLPDLTTSLIGSVIVLGQGLPQKFSNNTPSGRKEVLEKLFKSDYMIQDLKDRISQRKAELNDELRTTQDNKLIAQTKLNSTAELIETCSQRFEELKNKTDWELDIQTYQERVNEHTEKLSELNNSLEKYKEDLADATNKTIELEHRKTQEISTIDKSYADALATIQEDVNKSEVELRFSQEELNRVMNITDICPTCGQKLPDVHKPNIEKYQQDCESAKAKNKEIKNYLKVIQDEISQKKLAVTKSIEDEILLITNTSKSIREQIESIKISIKVQEVELSRNSKFLDEAISFQDIRLFEMQKLEETIVQHKDLRNKLMAELKNYEESETSLNERLSIISKFNTAITRDFRGYLLNDIIVYINSRAKEYCKIVFNTDLINFSLDGNNLLISYNNKEYEALSGGERQKIDLIIQFAIRDMLCKHTSFSSNIIVMDEIFDNLDDFGCQKILDLITTRLYDISSIFIISHHGNELNIPYDNIIKIEKDNSGITKVCT